MLIGQYRAKVSEKNQVAFPKRFREELGEKIIVTKGLDRNLIIVSLESWKTLLEGTEDKAFTDKNSREVQRFLLGNATEITLDSQGRFVLPDYLRRHAKIGREVVFAGIERFVEVWDKGLWEAHQEELAKNISSVAERLSKDTNG